IGLAAVALLATYAFARRLFRDEAVALVGLVLLAIDPSFIFYVPHDFDTTAFMALTKAVAGWQLLRWSYTGRTASLLLGAFAFGERVTPSGSFPSQLGQRVRVLGDLLDGKSVSRLTESPFPHHFRIVPLLVALAALAICIQLVARRPPSRELRAGAFVLLAA